MPTPARQNHAKRLGRIYKPHAAVYHTCNCGGLEATKMRPYNTPAAQWPPLLCPRLMHPESAPSCTCWQWYPRALGHVSLCIMQAPATRKQHCSWARHVGSKEEGNLAKATYGLNDNCHPPAASWRWMLHADPIRLVSQKGCPCW